MFLGLSCGAQLLAGVKPQQQPLVKYTKACLKSVCESLESCLYDHQQENPRDLSKLLT